MPAALRVHVRPQHARRAAALGILAAGGVLLPAGSAFAGVFAPEAGGSPNADDIRELYWFVFALGAVIFFAVTGLLLYSMLKFKAKKGAVAAQIHGNTRLEVGWTIGAALILVVISVVTFLKLGAIQDPPRSGADGIPVTKDGTFVAAGSRQRLPDDGKSLNIEVNGQQYLWRYTYPDGDANSLNNVFAYEEMVVPTNTTVTLEIRAQDVAHSWWIPKLGGKFDAIPGSTNFTWFKATKEGVFTGQCAELCGRNHANMTARVRAVSPPAFEAWYAQQKADIEASEQAAGDKRAEQIAAAQTAAGSTVTANAESETETP